MNQVVKGANVRVQQVMTEHGVDDMTAILDAAVDNNQLLEAKIPKFDYVEHYFDREMKDQTIVVVGGADNYDQAVVRDKYFPTERTVFVQVNGHFERNVLPCDVLFHTCCANPDIGPETVKMLEDAGKLDDLFFVFLNLVDGNYDVGNRPRPVYAEFLDEVAAWACRPEVSYFAQGTWAERNPYGPQYEWLNDLHKRYDAKFFTGNVALARVMRSPAAQIHVYGMDLYLEVTKANLRGYVESHEVEGNVRFMADALKDPRVWYDEPLMGALAKYGLGNS